MDVGTVERTLQRLYLGEHALRREDLKKAREVAPLLDDVARLHRGQVVVDAAAGHAYLGLCAAELAGVSRLHFIEREPARVERTRQAAARLSRPVELDVRCGNLSQPELWPEEPQLVVALHACGAASDDVIEGAIRVRARWLLLVPCCYARTLPAARRAESAAERMGLPRQAPVRRRFLRAFVDGERTLRLEAAGYEVTVAPFVSEAVTPHNLVWRARRVGEKRRMAEAAEKLARLTGA